MQESRKQKYHSCIKAIARMCTRMHTHIHTHTHISAAKAEDHMILLKCRDGASNLTVKHG